MKYNRTFQALAIPIVNVYDHLKYNYHVIGREKVPDGGCVLVANHTQWADPVLVGTALGNQYPLVAMAKKELFQIKLLGPLISALGAFPVDRGTADIGAIKTSLKAVKEGKKLLIFPEGKRVKPGMKSEPKTGAALFAVRGRVPLVPVYIPEGRKLFRRNTVVIGKAYMPEVEGKPDQQQYQLLTAELMERMLLQNADAYYLQQLKDAMQKKRIWMYM